MRIINQNLPITYPSIGTSPYELGLPVMTTRHFGNCIGVSSHSSFHFISFGGSLSITPMALVEREPILKNKNFQLSPTHCQVLWLYGKAGMVSHPNPTISFFFKQSPYHSSVIFNFKTFNRMTPHSKVWFKCSHLE